MSEQLVEVLPEMLGKKNKVWEGNVTITATRRQNKRENTQRETVLEVTIDFWREEKRQRQEIETVKR